MRDALQLYGRYVMVSLRGQMQYRASFIMLSVGTFVSSGIEFIGVWVMFERFGQLRGWHFAEVALFYGMISLAFALAEAATRGFDTFADMVRTGEFDRVLLRPRSTALQIMGRESQLLRIGRFIEGLGVRIFASASLQVAWTMRRILRLVLTVVGGACLFGGLFIVQATLCFWTIDSLEIMNTMTYGGVQAAQYPLTIYRDWFRRFFTFVVPLSTVTYFPAIAILDRADPLGTSRIFQYLSPLIGAAFLVVALLIWRVGVRHYHSTGS